MFKPLLAIITPYLTAQFDAPTYYNSCTMKSCCFAGDRDQFVVCGSDDFNVYVWKLPDSLQPKS
jgi:WD repeat-containing protein 22